MQRTAPVWCLASSTFSALLLLAACGGPGSPSGSAPSTADASACVSPQGGPCGGNIQGACSCEPGLTCTGGPLVGDVGGTCQPATCATTACSGPGQRCCEVPDASGVCTPRCLTSPVCPEMPCRAPTPCIQTQLCILGDHWDSHACRCVPNAGSACTTAADCQGVLPDLCMQCPSGAVGCAHWECVAGQCREAVCN